MAQHSVRPQGPAASPEAVIPATKTATAWFSLAAVMILIVAILCFILQNLQSVKVSFLSLNWRIPLGIDLLFAAIVGGLVVFAMGSMRILQLRRLARRHARKPHTESDR
jgi:uncharacterized integral membrane protein